MKNQAIRLKRIIIPAFGAVLIASSARGSILDITGTAGLTDQYDPTVNGAIGYEWQYMSAAMRLSAGTVDSASDLSNLSQMLQYPGIWVDERVSTTGTLSALETSNLKTYIATGRRVVFIGGGKNYASWDSAILSTVSGSYGNGIVNGVTVRSYIDELNSYTNVSSIYTQNGGVAASNNDPATNTLFADRVATVSGPCANVLVMLDPSTFSDDSWKVADDSNFGTNAAAWVAGTISSGNSPSQWASAASGSWTDPTTSKWTLSQRPSIGDDAVFSNAAAAAYTVSIATPVTVGNLIVSSDRVALNLATAGSLTVAKKILVGQTSYSFLTLTGLSTVSAAGAVVTPTGSLTVGPATHLVLSTPVTGNGSLIVNGSVTIGPGLGSAGMVAALTDTGLIDLTDTDLILTATGLSAATALVAGGSIVGNTDSAHQIAVVQNNQGNSPLYTAANLFDGIAPNPTDVLLKIAAIGDANLDGKIDGSDYTLIDNGYNKKLTGWYNGDFNYDGVINGSDYSLIDNAFNTQSAKPAVILANATDQVAAVPEPASAGAFLLSAAAIRPRRSRSARGRETESI